MNLGFHNKPTGTGLLGQFDCHLVGGIRRISNVAVLDGHSETLQNGLALVLVNVHAMNRLKCGAKVANTAPVSVVVCNHE